MRRTFHPQACLFDFDGVIADTTPANRRHWEAFARHIEIDEDTIFARASGRPTFEVMAEIRNVVDFDLDAEFAWFEDISRDDFEGIVAVDGVAEMLDQIPKSRWCIVTGGTNDTTRLLLQTLGLPVPRHLIANDAVSAGKPDPEGYLLGASLLGRAPADCLVLEDSPSGIVAGHRAGAKVAALLTSRTIDELPLELVSSVSADLTGVKVRTNVDGSLIVTTDSLPLPEIGRC